MLLHSPQKKSSRYMVIYCKVGKSLDQSTCWKWRWKAPVLSQIEAHQWEKCLEMIAGTHQRPGKDTWSWLPDKSGNFSVSSMRSILQKSSSGSQLLAHDWLRWLPIKINIFRWRLVRNRLPTMKNLAVRGVLGSNHLCHLCKTLEEDLDHLLLSCEFANQLQGDGVHVAKILEKEED
ncbi:hypothetical protein E3N88_12289 [Mikania micrantha]|uniref:Reverse transcriptase zinc-binding domain-containing protein n=1 Tax=Mikania micrantha TaxID=192012 RepID=A0A5N6P529_9ASTR|nr:hypothetical protein E3N88_12289 [Mikania micrantha]